MATEALLPRLLLGASERVASSSLAACSWVSVGAATRHARRHCCRPSPPGASAALVRESPGPRARPFLGQAGPADQLPGRPLLPPPAATSDRSPQNGSAAAAPVIETPRTAATAEERRARGLEEYQALKEELTRRSGYIAAFGFGYCFLGLSLQTALSYGFGSAFGVLYLQQLFAGAEGVTRANVPQVFQGRLPRKRGPLGTQVLTGTQVAGSPQRVLAGAGYALTSRRLLLPAAMMLVWAGSQAVAGGDPNTPQLELAPVLLGFLVYKASVLAYTLQNQEGLLKELL